MVVYESTAAGRAIKREQRVGRLLDPPVQSKPLKHNQTVRMYLRTLTAGVISELGLEPSASTIILSSWESPQHPRLV